MSEPAIVFFDMDHTVLEVDCDYLWKGFLIAQGLAPETDRPLADRYIDLYHQGICPVDEFLRFQLREFVGRTVDDMRALAEKHFTDNIDGHVFPQARAMIADYAANGIPTALLTGTNRILADPIGRDIGVDHVLATELEVAGGVFTGQITGPYLSKHGKVESAQSLCKQHGVTLSACAFYADSINDLDFLKLVGKPVTVNPKPNLREVAESLHWQIESWSC